MKTSLFFLLLSFLLTACGGGHSRRGKRRRLAAQRQAMFSLVLNEVQARLTADADLKPATPATGCRSAGRREAVKPGAPAWICSRMAPSSAWPRTRSSPLQALETQAEAPFSRLRLESGQVVGDFERRQPGGGNALRRGAAVRGSYLSVSFDETHGMVVTCLEGRCSLRTPLARSN